MAIIDGPDTSAQRTVTDNHFCPYCGHAAADGRFCPSCGSDLYEVTQQMPPTGPPPPPRYEQAAQPQYAPPPPPPPQATATATERHPNSRLAVIVAAAAFGLAAIAAAVILILSATSGSSGTSYRDKLSSALSPVLAANTTLSQSLQGLSGSQTQTAKGATTQAQQAVAQARGAVAVLSVPSSDQQLSQQVQQALAQESSYLQSVQDALNNPSASGQLQTEAGNTSAALVPLNAVAPGIGSSLNATSTLVSWAAGRVAASNRHKRQARPTRITIVQPSPPVAQPQPQPPVATTKDCGNGVSANQNTSCAFALNVKAAWEAAPGVNNTVQVYSPVTGQTYTMNCTQAGSGITCSGGNNASVSWQ